MTEEIEYSYVTGHKGVHVARIHRHHLHFRRRPGSHGAHRSITEGDRPGCLKSISRSEWVSNPAEAGKKDLQHRGLIRTSPPVKATPPRPARATSGCAPSSSSAHAAAKSKGTYLSERYGQIARRRGKKKAIVAVAHEILLAAYRVLDTGEPYHDRGPEVVRIEPDDTRKKRFISELHRLGYSVSLILIPQPAA